MRHLMRSSRPLVLLLLLPGLVSALTTEEYTTIEAYETAVESTVLVVVRGDDPSTDLPGRELVVTASGVAIQPGLLITNYHVIENADQIVIFARGHDPVSAVLVGTAPGLDLALLRVSLSAETLPPAVLGASLDLRVGQTVLAVGSPYGLEHTVTAGIVSGLNREIPGLELGPSLIQFDAPINPGQSGGPLVDSEGRVVGITTAKVRGAEALGLAIPIEIALGVAPELEEMGHVFRPQIGFGGIAVDSDLARLFDLPVSSGVLIQDIEVGSPAEVAGLVAGDRHVILGDRHYVLGGDIVVGLNSAPVQGPTDLLLRLLTFRPGDEVSLSVVNWAGRRSVDLVVPPMEH